MTPGGVELIRFDSIDSTNDEAKRRFASGAIGAMPVAITAGEQTAGRGTRGRAWDSPLGAGIYVSVAVTSEAAVFGGSVSGPPRADRPWTLAAGVAAADAIRREFGIEARLKPVNDLIVDGRKLGGILTETTVCGDRIESLVVGLGLNVRGSERRTDDRGLEPVTLEMLRPPGVPIGGEEVERLRLALVDALLESIRSAATESDDSIRDAWLERAIPGAQLPTA